MENLKKDKQKIDSHLNGADLPENLASEIREQTLETRFKSFVDYTDLMEAEHMAGEGSLKFELISETIRQRKNEVAGYKRALITSNNLHMKLCDAVWPGNTGLMRPRPGSGQIRGSLPEDLEILKKIKKQYNRCKRPTG